MFFYYIILSLVILLIQKKDKNAHNDLHKHTYKTCLNPNIAWVTRRDSSLNEYVVRTDHHENINRNESGPTNDYVGYEYSEISDTISKGTNFRGLE